MTPSDESEIYDPMFPHQENGEENLIKPSNVKNRRSLQQGKTNEINGFLLTLDNRVLVIIGLRDIALL